MWKCYIPTIGMIILTTTAILCNGKINAKKIAVLTSAYSGATEALKKVEEKLTEEFGPMKADKIITGAETEVAKAQMPAGQNDIIATGKGKHAEGGYTLATGSGYAHAEGYKTISANEASHAEGGYTLAA